MHFYSISIQILLISSVDKLLSDICHIVKDGVQDMAGVEGLSDLPLKQVLNTSCERYSPYTWKKGASLFLKMQGCKGECERTGLVEFPPICYT